MRATVTRAEIDVTVASLGYKLSPEQRAPLYDIEHPVVLMAGGAGGGKSFIGGLFGTTRLMYTPLLWVVGPTYELARAEFGELHANLERVDLLAEGSVSLPLTGRWTMRTVLGQRIETQSADDVRKLAAKGPTGIIVAEAALHPYEVFLRCMERLTRAEATQYRPWVFLSGTFEIGRRWYADLWETLQGDNVWSGQSYSVPTWCNPHLYPQGREDPQIVAMERAFPAERFIERFGAKPVPPANVIFKSFSHAVHVRQDVVFNKDWPVELWIDPGYSGSNYAVEVVQFPPSDAALGGSEKQEVWVVDEIFGELAIAQEIILVAKSRPWWDNVKGGVIDVAGRQHAAAASQIEIWASEAGIGLRSQRVGVQEGIDRHQTFLKDPATGEARIFYNPGCVGILGEYGRWQRKTVTVDKIAINQPERGSCDGLKAVSYGLFDEFGPVERKKARPPKRREYPW